MTRHPRWSPFEDGGRQPTRMAESLDVVVASFGGPSVRTIVTVHDRWEDVVGAEVVAHAHPVGIDDGCLRIQVDGPAWASHVKWSEPEIVARLDTVVGAGVITSVSVSVARRGSSGVAGPDLR